MGRRFKITVSTASRIRDIFSSEPPEWDVVDTDTRENRGTYISSEAARDAADRLERAAIKASMNKACSDEAKSRGYKLHTKIAAIKK